MLRTKHSLAAMLLATVGSSLMTSGCQRSIVENESATESKAVAVAEAEQTYPRRLLDQSAKVVPVALNFPVPPAPVTTTNPFCVESKNQPEPAQKSVELCRLPQGNTSLSSFAARRQSGVQLAPPTISPNSQPWNSGANAGHQGGFYASEPADARVQFTDEMYLPEPPRQPARVTPRTAPPVAQQPVAPPQGEHFSPAIRATEPATDNRQGFATSRFADPSPELAEPVAQPTLEAEPWSAEVMVPHEAPADESTIQRSPAVADRVPQVKLATDDPALAAALARANALNEHAVMLAQRGASYSARAEFIQVLRRMTQILDSAQGTRAHSQALAAGFRALEEADDFLPDGANLEADLDLYAVISSHRTPALKNVDLHQLTPMAAVQEYYTFAQEQLIIAGGGLPPASKALFGMGRLQEMLHSDGSVDSMRTAPRAMVFYQASMMVDQTNHAAANELGVLLAQFGQYETARDVLLHSVRVLPQPESWHNLAYVHARLGESDLAKLAENEARLANERPARTGASSDAIVRWVPPEAFAEAPIQADNRIHTQAAVPAPVEAQPASTPSSRPMARFLRWRRGD